MVHVKYEAGFTDFYFSKILGFVPDEIRPR